jgi:hypothetical protein
VRERERERESLRGDTRYHPSGILVMLHCAALRTIEIVAVGSLSQVSRLLFIQGSQNQTNGKSKPTSGTVVSYGVLMNTGGLSLTSDTRTIIGIFLFRRDDLIMQEIWKERKQIN